MLAFVRYEIPDHTLRSVRFNVVLSVNFWTRSLLSTGLSYFRHFVVVAFQSDADTACTM